MLTYSLTCVYCSKSYQVKQEIELSCECCLYIAFNYNRHIPISKMKTIISFWNSVVKIVEMSNFNMVSFDVFVTP